MSFSVDPPRRAGPIRRTRKSAAQQPDDANEGSASAANLPVPLGQAETVAPAQPLHGPSAVEAQLLGQTGARRGLRAGPGVIETANHAYNKTEWSGEKDRRAPKGRAAKTKI